MPLLRTKNPEPVVITEDSSQYKREYYAYRKEREWPYSLRCSAAGLKTMEAAIEANKPYIHLGNTWVEERLTRIVHSAQCQPVCT